MAVSIIKRPINYTINASSVALYDADNNSGDVIFNKVSGSHGLVDGNHVYIKSSVYEYNGFWFVDSIDGDSFKIMEYATGTPIAWIKDIDGLVEVYKVSDEDGHGWNCIHLPIVYKLSNNLWPTNSVDTVRTISSITNSNGYCELHLSGDIKATGSANALEFVNITAAAGESVEGIHQIITYTDDSTFTVNITYNVNNAFFLSGAFIQYYYNNYVTKVQIWAGINNGHSFYAQKPYELLATLNLIPDENNICLFSINEILRSKIKVTNNLLLGTLPNNLDAFTMFYIKSGEEYDKGDGSTLGRSDVTYTSDGSNFEGFAVNSKLPFKNIYSGGLSDYARGDEYQKFMTLFETPVIFSNQYFDISFIVPNDNGGLSLRKELYSNNILILSSDISIPDYDEGVYRLKIDSETICDEISTEVLNSSLTSITGWSNSSSGRTWNIGTYTLESYLTSDIITPTIFNGTDAYLVIYGFTGISTISSFLKQSSGSSVDEYLHGVQSGTNINIIHEFVAFDDFDIIELKFSQVNPSSDPQFSEIYLLSKISITNPSFDSGLSPWTNEDTGGQSWSGAIDGQATTVLSSIPNDVSDYLQNTTLSSPIVSGDYILVILNVQVESGISVQFDIFITDGINTSNALNYTLIGNDVITSINIFGTVSGIGFTSGSTIQIDAQKISGTSGIVSIRNVSISKKDYTIPNGSFSSTGSWTTSGSEWLIAGDGIAKLLYSASGGTGFKVHFLALETSKNAIKTISILQGYTAEYNISIIAISYDSLSVGINYNILFKSSGTTVHTISGTLTNESSFNIIGSFLATSTIDQVLINAENLGPSIKTTFAVLSFVVDAVAQPDRIDVTIINEDDDPVTETKSLLIDCNCINSQSQGYYLSWLNYIGRFECWYFTAYSDSIIDIIDSGETENNLFPEWPNSYGEFSDTIRKQTFRDSRESRLIRSQHITESQLQAIKYIKTSPLVQIVNSIYDRRTVLVDTDSFTYFKEEDKLYTISFTISYTDDVPSQRV